MKLKHLIPVLMIVSLSMACIHGLPTEQQNSNIQAVVKACFDNKAMASSVDYDPVFEYTTVTCYWHKR